LEKKNNALFRTKKVSCMVQLQNGQLTHDGDRSKQSISFQDIGPVDAAHHKPVEMKPQLNQMAQEFTPHSVAKKQQQQQLMHQQQIAAQGGYGGGYPVNQQAALQAAMMNPSALQAMLQNQNPHFIHHIQQQQLQQLQQLHQQNLRLAAAFNQNQMGIYNATSALLQQIPPEQQQQQQQQQQQRQQTVADQTNNDFEHFPTREDVCPSPPIQAQAQVIPKKPKSLKGKDHNKDSAFDDISDDSSDSNGSSYITMELEDSEIPEQEVLEQICRQVEEYLSDDYLATDKYLLRQLRSKSEGYLSVKLLTSFKKIKKLTRDWRVTAHALKLSGIVELSNDGHRVKRKANLPENLRRGRTMTSILAIRVPDDWATLEAITNIFSAYGNITLARVLRPGRAIPPDLRNYATQIPDMGATTCAVVDFDSTDSAHECCRGLRDKNLRGMRIALLGPRIRRTLYKAEKKKIPENRHQRRLNTVHQKNVSKEEGLKIIQTYFHNQVKPTPDDPIDFPPLHASNQPTHGGAHHAFHPFDQMAAQMHGLTISTPKAVNSSSSNHAAHRKWPGVGQPNHHHKPTLSQIVAQNHNQSHPVQHGQSDHGDTLSDHSSESGLCSPKPANCDVKPIKQFKGWNLTPETKHVQMKDDGHDGQNDHNAGWCPWSTTNFGVEDDEDDQSSLENMPRANPPSQISPVDFTFDPIPSLAIGQGIWSNVTNSESGW
jgi:hypothetical protein